MVKNKLVRLEKAAAGIHIPTPPMTPAEAADRLEVLCQRLQGLIDGTERPAPGPPDPESQRIWQRIRQRLGLR